MKYLNLNAQISKPKNVAAGVLSVVVFLVLATSSISAKAAPGSFLGPNDAPIIAYADSSEIFTVVEQMPEVKGGLSEIYKHIEYPREATSRGVEGRVFIKFVVTENGDVESPQVLKDIGAGCGEAAVKGIKKVKFIPGKHQGKAVKVYYTMPINFEITD